MPVESALIPTPLMKGRAIDFWWFWILLNCTVWMVVAPRLLPRSEFNGRILALKAPTYKSVRVLAKNPSRSERQTLGAYLKLNLRSDWEATHCTENSPKGAMADTVRSESRMPE